MLISLQSRKTSVLRPSSFPVCSWISSRKTLTTNDNLLVSIPWLATPGLLIIVIISATCLPSNAFISTSTTHYTVALHPPAASYNTDFPPRFPLILPGVHLLHQPLSLLCP
ncbi:hypothetical protein ATANTOWER_019349 [Ataeniobius toweri]|uniref:Uncharacterized protein n=1 Tax=Ataeniobius toweri TaxID=208326 RepID=A0ABU7A782_9TELE|nr:hypothetical protein [Ataeniobius toweri]